MRLFHFSMRGSSVAALNAPLSLKPVLLSNRFRAKEVMLRTYPKMVNCLLQICSTDDVIAKTDAA